MRNSRGSDERDWLKKNRELRRNTCKRQTYAFSKWLNEYTVYFVKNLPAKIRTRVGIVWDICCSAVCRVNEHDGLRIKFEKTIDKTSNSLKGQFVNLTPTHLLRAKIS